MYDLLIKCPLFKGLSMDEIEEEFEKINYHIKSFEKEQIISSRGDTCKNLMVVISGSVRGEMLDYSGKILKVEDIHAPKPVAVAFLFGANNRYPVDVISNKESEMLVIPLEGVLKLFQENGKILRNYLDVIANRAQFLTQRIWFLSFKTIKGKLAQYLLNLSKKDDKHLVLDKTQQELADFFGVTRPSLARGLGEMEKSGIIEVNRKNITILNKQELQALLE